MYVNILLAQNIESNHHLISYEVLRHGSIPAPFTRNDWERFVLYISIELFHNQYYCMIFKLPQSPAVFFWFCLYFLLLFFSWTGYNTSSSPIYHFNKTVNNAGSSFDEVRHARNFLCLVSSIIVNKALQLDDEVEGMLFWEKDIPFLNPLEMRYVDGKQSGSQQIYWELPNNLLLAFGVGYEDAFRNISRLLVIACTLPTTRAEAEPPFHWWNESRPALGQQCLKSNSLISQWLPRTIFREIRGGGRRDTPASLCNGSSKKALSG